MTRWCRKRRVAPAIGPDLGLDLRSNGDGGRIVPPAWLAANAVGAGGAHFARMALCDIGNGMLGHQPTFPGEIPVHGARRCANYLVATETWSPEKWLTPTPGSVTYPEPGVVRIVPTSPGLNQVWIAQIRLFDYAYALAVVAIAASVEIRLVQDEGTKWLTLEVSRSTSDGTMYAGWGGRVPITRAWRRVRAPWSAGSTSIDYRRLHWVLGTWWDVTAGELPQYGVELRRPMAELVNVRAEDVSQEYVDGDRNYGFGAAGVYYSATSSPLRWSPSTRLITAGAIPARLTGIRGIRPATPMTTGDASCPPNLWDTVAGRLVNAWLDASNTMHGCLALRDLVATGSGVHYVYVALGTQAAHHISAVLVKQNVCRPQIYATGSGWWAQVDVAADWSAATVTGVSGCNATASIVALGNGAYRLDVFVAGVAGAAQTAQLRVVRSDGAVDYAASGERLSVCMFTACQGEWVDEPAWGRTVQSRSQHECFYMPSINLGENWLVAADIRRDCALPPSLYNSVGVNFASSYQFMYASPDGNLAWALSNGGTWRARALPAGRQAVLLHRADGLIRSLVGGVPSAPEAGALTLDGAPSIGPRHTQIETYGPLSVRRVGLWKARRLSAAMVDEIARWWAAEA